MSPEAGAPARGAFEEPPAELTPHTAWGFTTTSSDYDRAVTANERGAMRLVASLPDEGYESVLDVGCGTGFAATAAMERFPSIRRLVGVDPAEGMLAGLRAKLVDRPEIEADLQPVPAADMRVAPESVDLAISTMVFHWLPDRAAVAALMAAALRPGGVLALLAPSAGADRQFFEIVEELDPPAPPEWLAAERRYLVDPADVERAIEGTGLVIEDIWVEERRPRVSPEEFVTRMQAVATHVFLRTPGYDAADLDGAWRRTVEAIEARAADSGRFEYQFNKVFVIARRQ